MSNNTPALSDLSDAELAAEVRRRTIEILDSLGGLQLVRAYESVRDIALGCPAT